MSGYDEGQAHSRLTMSCNNETSKNEYIYMQNTSIWPLHFLIILYVHTQ